VIIEISILIFPNQTFADVIRQFATWSTQRFQTLGRFMSGNPWFEFSWAKKIVDMNPQVCFYKKVLRSTVIKIIFGQ
jgi:hypothetical protein